MTTERKKIEQKIAEHDKKLEKFHAEKRGQQDLKRVEK
jgi:restriction endonuclease S subunit